MKLTAVMPYLNETETVETCIRKAFFVDHRIDSEVVDARFPQLDVNYQPHRSFDVELP